MAKKEKTESTPTSTRDKITAYFRRRTGFCAKASTDLKYLVRQQCSAAGLGTSDEEMALMAAGLSTFMLADYTPAPLPAAD